MPGWAKDHIAHNAAWIADAARVIAAAVRGDTPEPSPADVEFNPKVFAAEQHQSWEAILAGASAADAALQAALEACSESDLSDPARFPWREDRPLWFVAHVCGNEHPAEHYGQFYLDRGDVVRACEVREEAVKTACRFIGETEPYGFMLYNLGCFYAKIGRRDQALASLGEALARVPRLREWSREDPELVSLHDDPAFQALILETVGAADGGSSGTATD